MRAAARLATLPKRLNALERLEQRINVVRTQPIPNRLLDAFP
jgi:hypothetical protein